MQEKMCAVHRRDRITSKSQRARIMGPTWGPPGSCRPQVGPMYAPWTLLSGIILRWCMVWRLDYYLVAAPCQTRENERMRYNKYNIFWRRRKDPQILPTCPFVYLLYRKIWKLARIICTFVRKKKICFVDVSITQFFTQCISTKWPGDTAIRFSIH